MRGMGAGGSRHDLQERGQAELKDVPLSRIYGLFRKYRGQLTAIVLLALVGGVIGLIPPARDAGDHRSCAAGRQ